MGNCFLSEPKLAVESSTAQTKIALDSFLFPRNADLVPGENQPNKITGERSIIAKCIPNAILFSRAAVSGNRLPLSFPGDN
jgi:hypothetical protein